jgi:hypothetical protein
VDADLETPPGALRYSATSSGRSAEPVAADVTPRSGFQSPSLLSTGNAIRAAGGIPASTTFLRHASVIAVLAIAPSRNVCLPARAPRPSFAVRRVRYGVDDRFDAPVRDLLGDPRRSRTAANYSSCQPTCCNNCYRELAGG